MVKNGITVEEIKNVFVSECKYFQKLTFFLKNLFKCRKVIPLKISNNIFVFKL